MIVSTKRLHYVTNPDNPVRDGWKVCGSSPIEVVHTMADGHEFDDSGRIHESHKMAIHPIDGLYCVDCKEYTYDKSSGLDQECVGVREWKAREDGVATGKVYHFADWTRKDGRNMPQYALCGQVVESGGDSLHWFAILISKANCQECIRLRSERENA